MPASCSHLGIWAQSGQILAFSRKAGKSRLLYEISQVLNFNLKHILNADWAKLNPSVAECGLSLQLWVKGFGPWL